MTGHGQGAREERSRREALNALEEAGLHVSDKLPEQVKSVPRNGFWKYEDGRKIPRAPHNNDDWIDKWVDAHNPEHWLDYEDWEHYNSMFPDHMGFRHSWVIPPREADLSGPKGDCREVVLVDFDDVIVDGALHPGVFRFLKECDTYGQISTSWTGLHLIGTGTLPEDVKSVVIDLSNEQFPDAEVEIYDAGRFIAMTGRHVSDTPTEFRDITCQVHRYAERYETIGEEEEDEDDYREPTYGDDDLKSMDTTDDMDAIYDAIDSMSYVASRFDSTETASRGKGKVDLDPSWETSNSGTRIGVLDKNVGKMVYRDGMIGISPFQLVALEERIISSPGDYPEGQDWWDTVEACRRRGFHIPELDEDAEREMPEDERGPTYTPVIPTDPSDKRLMNGVWDYEHASRSTFGKPLIDRIRERVGDRIEKAINCKELVVVDGPPASGKTTGMADRIKATNEPALALADRGRDEQYAKIQKKCRERGLTSYILPSFKADCPCANGEHGEEVKDRVDDLYRRKATPQEIHKRYERKYGEEMPCKVDGECPYCAKWSFDPDDYDVLIGHYNHAHLEAVTAGRVVFCDEFPAAWETEFSNPPKSQITIYLQRTPELPFDDYADLMEKRQDDEIRAEALDYFLTNGVERDPETVFATEAGSANAPLYTFTLIAAAKNDLGNGYEHIEFPDGRRKGVYNRENDSMGIINPPEWKYATAFIGLDGTPVEEMWQIVTGLGEDLEVANVLNRDEKQQYITEALNLKIYQTTEYKKPCHNEEFRNPQESAALIEDAYDRFDIPDVISSRAAIRELEKMGIEEKMAKTGYYGNILGSDKHGDASMGILIGSPHYGDQYIGRWAAYAGAAADLERDPSNPYGKDDYGTMGNAVLKYMREYQVLQALLRFGRDASGAVIYCHTSALPDWVPRERGAVVETWSEGKREIVEAVNELGLDEWEVADVAEKVRSSPNWTRQKLNELADDGWMDREFDGQKYIYTDNGAEEIKKHGALEFETEVVDPNDITPSTRTELTRNTIYTWSFGSTAAPIAHGRSLLWETSIDKHEHAVLAARIEPPPD